MKVNPLLLANNSEGLCNKIIYNLQARLVYNDLQAEHICSWMVVSASVKVRDGGRFDPIACILWHLCMATSLACVSVVDQCTTHAKYNSQGQNHARTQPTTAANKCGKGGVYVGIGTVCE